MHAFSAFVALAAKALVRRRLRTSVAVGGVGLAVAVVLSVAGFGRGYQQSLDEDLRHLGYEIVVTAKGCPYEAATMIMRGGNIPMYLQSDLAQKVTEDPEVAASTRMFMQTAPPGDRPEAVLHLGIDDGYLALKPWLKLQRGAWFSGPDADEVIAGNNAAELLGLEPGGEIELGHRQMMRRKYKVVGVLNFSGSQDDGTLFLPIRSAQYLFDKKEMVTGVGLKLKDPEQAGPFMERMYKLPSVQVVTMSHVRTGILTLLENARMLIAAVTAVTTIIALFGVMNSVLFSVLERTAVLGVMKALGAKGRDLMLLVVLETVLLCGTGGALGIALAYGGSGIVQALLRRILPFTPNGSLLALPPIYPLAAFAGSLVAGVAAGCYPGARAALIDPVKSIRADG